jgi:cellulose synthase/poly-beta-1,6-N-acetylglucosamine synthase-like glycosyltransferase
VRTILLGTLGLLQWLVAPWTRRRPYEGPVTAIVPAHNEEAMIARALDALLASDYPDLEILVVDDGSSDRTPDIVAGYARRAVRLIRQANAGKANALRTGFAAARYPIVVALDADTLFTPSTVRHLVQAFGDPRVGAVSGNARVGNRVNALTWFQELEYVLTLNLERRAYALLNCIPVVPVAVGAWRREAVLSVCGFTASTLAEDTDVTMALGRARYRVAYAPAALAYTEAPQTLHGLIRQRTRWSFGTLQCLWKHRRATFSPRSGALGLIAIPGLWLSQLLFPAIAPAMDLGLVLSPLTPWAPRILVATAAYNGALILLALWALAVDREPLWLAGLIPLQNFLYRQFAYAIALKAVLRALRGVRMGWHRVQRLGTSTLDRGMQLPGG